jgi:hypothetical protein
MLRRPGEPDLNAAIERFDGSYLKVSLDAYPVGSLDDIPVERNSGQADGSSRGATSPAILGQVRTHIRILEA